MGNCKHICLLPALVAIAWILPQSLFSDCVGVGWQVENGIYTEQDCVKLFDVSKDEIEITWGIKKIIKGFQPTD